MKCQTGRLKRKYQEKLTRLDDKNLLDASHINDTASEVRKRNGREGPDNRMWRRLIKQEVAKRGLRT